MARLRIQSGPDAMVNLKNIAARERLPDIVTTSELFNGRYFAAPEIANALVGAKEITSGLYSIPFYKSFMALKAGAQVSTNYFISNDTNKKLYNSFYVSTCKRFDWRPNRI